MRQEDIDKFGFELFEFVFTTLDEYFPDHEMTAQEAGRIAGNLARAYRSALEEHFGVGEFAPDRMCESEGPDGPPCISTGFHRKEKSDESLQALRRVSGSA